MRKCALILKVPRDRTKFTSEKKVIILMFHEGYIILQIQRIEGQPDEPAHFEPHHLDLLYLLIQLQQNFNGSNMLGPSKYVQDRGNSS